MDYSEMRAMQYREENGYLPDEHYQPTVEDAFDPDHHEIAALVQDQYARTNIRRAEERLREENASLRAMLTSLGMDPAEIDRVVSGN